ncbi:MAG: HepT-like ribonuclease domain-containing protein [Candidatus Falkowbacteria bacterium]
MNNLSESFKSKNFEIEFRDIIAMRNFIIHQYIEVDFEIVWKTCQNDLPKLKKLIKPLIK